MLLFASIHRGRESWLRRLSALVLAATVGCGADSLKPAPFLPAADLLWSVELNHHAVTLSTAPSAGYDTVQLAVTPRNHLGAPLAGVSDVQYVSRNLEYVTVTPEGLVRAVKPLAPNSMISVVATTRQGDMTLADSVLIQVVDDADPPRLGELVARPASSDSAKLALTTSNMGLPLTDTLTTHITDADGAPLELLTVFRSSDSTIAPIGPVTGVLYGQRPGPVNFYVEATAFGRTRADTVAYRIGWPVLGSVLIDRRSTPGLSRNFLGNPEIFVGAGAMVFWYALSADTSEPVNIRFADPTNVAAASTAPFPLDSLNAFFAMFGCAFTDCTEAGDIVMHPVERDGVFYGFGTAVRLFSVPGTYEYRNTATGASGKIVVMDER